MKIRDENVKKSWCFVIILLFVGASIVPQVVSEKKKVEMNSLLIVYPPDEVHVNNDYNESTPGWGYDHFDNIQDGVDAVNISGTVLVHNGTYYDNVVIDQELTLMGEDEDEGGSNNFSIIDGNNSSDVIKVQADDVEIANLNITNSGNSFDESGIHIYEFNRIVISQNHIYNNGCGIKTLGNGIEIRENDINSNKYDGIFTQGDDIIISDNTINFSGLANEIDHGMGIEISYFSNNIEIYGNIIDSTCAVGTYIDKSTYVTIQDNLIINCDQNGIMIDNSNEVTIFENNIVYNGLPDIPRRYRGGIEIWFSSRKDNVSIYHNNISNNYYNLILHQSFIPNHKIESNNILDPVKKQVYAMLTIALLNYNWWGNPDMGPYFNMRCIFSIIFALRMATFEITWWEN